MPSILARAAMAALAGSGGRQLDGSGGSGGSGGTACTHDICGRKLLQRNQISGPKFLKAGSNEVFDSNGNLLGRQVYAGNFADGDFVTEEIDMDENGHNLPGNPSVKASIVSDKVKFELSMGSQYIHNFHNCQLKVVPSIIGGADSADGTTNKKLTSATFNPYNSHASVADVSGVWAYDSGTSGSGKFTAVVDDPAIEDASLGYLGVEFDVEIDCANDKSVANPPPTKIYHHTIVDENGNQVMDGQEKTYQKLRVRHKFVEDPADLLPLQSDATTPVTLTDPAAQWGSGSHKKMPVNIAASTTVQTEAGAVRFPSGEWASQGIFGAQAKAAGAKLSCELSQGTLHASLNDVKGNWFDADAGAGVVEAAYGDLQDVACADDTAGVSCGIKYTATIASTTEKALGFQVPLASYYDGSVPSVSCQETQNSKTASKNVNISGRGDHALGNIKKSLVFTGLTPSVSEYGEGFFTLDSGAYEQVFNKLLTVAQATEAPWYDLAEEYDYTWQLKYKIGQVEHEEVGALSSDTGKIASQGAALAAVQYTLEGKVNGYIANTTFARPKLYGEQRDHYHIGNAQATAAFRRSKAEIDLTISGQNDGTLDYNGAVSDVAGIAFPGYLEDFNVGDAKITACAYCSGAVDEVNNDVKIQPARSGEEQAAEWQLFAADDTAGKTDTVLFDQTQGICEESNSPAWCVSKASADDIVGRGNRVQCKNQSVTFQVTATMQDEDSRVASSSVVTQTYIDTAAGEPAKPTTADRAGIQYQLAGAQLKETFAGVELATDPQNIGALTFTRPHDDLQGYSCSLAAGTVFTYTSPYYTFCDSVSDPITYRVATNVVYSDAQVKVGAALSSGSAGDSAETAIREYDIQGRQTNAPGVDIKFTVSASTDNHGLKFDETLQVKVKHAALTNGETLLSVADGSCTLASDKASAECTLSGFKDPSFDPDDTLDIDEHCGTAGEVACPSFDLEVSQEFNVPKTDASVGAFQSAVVAEGDDCSTKRRHVISLADSGSNAKDIVISIDVDGSEEIHNELVELFATFDGEEKARFAHAAAESGSQSTGTSSEYSTIMAIQNETSRLPANMRELNLKITIHGEDTSTDAVVYTVKNEGRAADYKMYLCANSANYEQCGKNEFPSAGKQYFILGDGANAGFTDLYVRIDDAAGSGADPCLDKIKGVQAFGEGVKFSIARNGEQAHTYTVPITCHTSGTPTISYVSGPTNNGINWNQELLTVAVSGRSIDATKSVDILGLTGTLEQDASALISTDPSADVYLQAVLTLKFEKENCADVAEADVTFHGESLSQALTCPVSALGIQGIVRDSLVTPKATFGDVLAVDMLIFGRDQLRYGEAVQLRNSTGSDNDDSGETVKFLDDSSQEVSELSIPDVGSNADAKTVYIKVKPAANDRIKCNFLEIEVSALTVANDNDSRKAFTFRMKCPRQQSSSAATDVLDLAYDVSKFAYSHTLMEIDVPLDPAGVTSDIALGKCSGTSLVKADDAACSLSPGDNDKSGGEAGLDLFNTCAKHSYDGTVWSGETIVSKATVAREYTRTDSVFGTSTYCGETPLTISVTKTKTSSIAIAIADNNDMRFDVHMSALSWEKSDCGGDQYRLSALVEMKRQLGVNGPNGFIPLTDAEGNPLPYVDTGIESYFRTGLADVEYYAGSYVAGQGIAHDAHQQNTGALLLIRGGCVAPDSELRDLAFVMKVEEEGVDYFSHANINFQVDAPDAENSALAFLPSHTTTNVKCSLVGADFPVEDCTQGASDSPIPSNFQVKLQVGVTAEEADAFRHAYSAPRIRQSALDADENCDLFASDPSVADCPLVSGLSPLASHQAILTVDGTSTPQALVQGEGDDANSIVMLKTVPFAGDANVEIGWTISRIENTEGAGRRLRAVKHVTYTLGADGSVSKSSTFAVAPAVRESDGASVVTTVEEITYEWADGSNETHTRTSKEMSKEGEDHVLAILGIVFGGLGSIAAIAVAFFVGCSTKRDASGVGSSFKTVTSDFSDRQPLFNRNRFAPSDF